MKREEREAPREACGGNSAGTVDDVIRGPTSDADEIVISQVTSFRRRDTTSTCLEMDLSPISRVEIAQLDETQEEHKDTRARDVGFGSLRART